MLELVTRRTAPAFVERDYPLLSPNRRHAAITSRAGLVLAPPKPIHTPRHSSERLPAYHACPNAATRINGRPTMTANRFQNPFTAMKSTETVEAAFAWLMANSPDLFSAAVRTRDEPWKFVTTTRGATSRRADTRLDHVCSAVFWEFGRRVTDVRPPKPKSSCLPAVEPLSRET